MPLFKYKARNSRGDALSGEIEAGSSDIVAAQLLNSGITPISIEETQAKQDIWADIKLRLGTQKPDLDDLILFCRQMYTLTHAGVPLIRGITGLGDTSRNAVLADALHKIRFELESGRELSLAMGQFPDIFTPMMISMVRVGESTGKLDEAFLQLSTYLELERDTRKRVKAALRYPTFVLIAISAAITIVNIWVIPAFADVFKGMNVELPWQTKALISISDYFVAHWPLLLSSLAGTLVWVRYYVKTEKGRYKWDKVKLKMPIVGDIILRATLARFARSFAMTTRSGVPLIQAMSVTARAVDNEYVNERVLSMRNGIERGDTLTRTAAATSLFTPLVLQMLSVGEETGAVEQMMDEVAGFYEREVDYDLKNLSSSIEPILIVAVGILVLILALGIFLPMWDITQLTRL